MSKLRIFIIALLLLTINFVVTAAPRSLAQMRQAALRVLSAQQLGVKHAPNVKGQIKLLRQEKGTCILGYENGGFVVVTTDDLLPEVIGYSETAYKANSGNEGFKWWLNATEKAAREVIKSGTKHISIAPADNGFPSAIPELLTSRWGQETPYNNLCPIGTSTSGNGRGRCMTGCVATAMAQVLNYFKSPLKGIGTYTIGVKQNGGGTDSTTIDYGSTTFDWANILDEYHDGSYTTEEANAVATLMVCCGVAADMQYYTDGSGTLTQNAVDGLRRNFGFANARMLKRADNVYQNWMDTIYTELSHLRPIYYSGMDSYYGGGHAFVFDGYDNQGNVHVNWGWEGDANGYYDVQLLNVMNYDFTADQDMIIGLQGDSAVMDTVTIENNKAGGLSTAIPEENRTSIAYLTVTGEINSSDLKIIREIAGRDSEGKGTRGQLMDLDISNAKIVSGGEPYLAEDGEAFTTSDNEIPYKAFYATRLRTIALPTSTEYIKPGAFTACNRLDTVALAKDYGKGFTIDGKLIYSEDTTELIGSLPNVEGDITLPQTVTTIDDYALYNSHGVTSITIPSSVTNIGVAALSSNGLTTIKIYAKKIPATGDKCFSNVDKTACTLLVPAGCKKAYSEAKQWKEFVGTRKDGIKEFGTILKARNAIREYGDDNPKFGWEKVGENVTGRPTVTCIADKNSPVGEYTIVIGYGTIDSTDVELQNGTLRVTAAPLTVKADDQTRSIGETNPDLTYTCSGFKNNENDTVFTIKPLLTTTAVTGSPIGDYPIYVSGGEAANYELNYVEGVLHITDTTTGISSIEASSDNGGGFVYSISGQRVSNPKNGLYIIQKDGKTYKKVVKQP